MSDARRAYETKAESKPAVFPALKVSDAKKAFEVAASAAAAAASVPKISAGHSHNRLQLLYCKFNQLHDRIQFNLID